MPYSITFVIYPDFQLLDLTGPLAVLETAEALRPGSYHWAIEAVQPGDIRSSSGVGIRARSLRRRASLHTVIAVGGFGCREASQDLRIKTFLRGCAGKKLRVTSVCTGSYLLAAAGLLQGKAATTHWHHTTDAAQRYPEVNWESDKIYIKAGQLWTSAGVTAGIDLALALLTEDYGEQLARLVARHLVVYYRRPGGQSQFSSLLEHSSSNERFEALLDYIRTHLRQPLTVQQLATRTGMSARNFSRSFRAATGHSPANTVERIRAETARTALESGACSISEVAANSGFGDPERMRRCFLRQFGVSPSTLKR